ncbi:MAG: hypothetical protein K9L88_20015 [Chromatiaceae bacterium]|nr:hypothetical protein [Chromatiaceae bacterium]
MENIQSFVIAFRTIVTAHSAIVTGDSGQCAEIGHDPAESPVTFLRYRWSRSAGTGGHDRAEYAAVEAAQAQQGLLTEGHMAYWKR